MADAVTHRGPDDAGVWIDGKAGVALASRRLAVVDLSPAGHQPMQSMSKRRVIVFNGEIYIGESIDGGRCAVPSPGRHPGQGGSGGDGREPRDAGPPFWITA